MLTIKDIYYLCQRDQAAHSESGEAVIIFYSRWGIEGYVTLPGGILLQWGYIKNNEKNIEVTSPFYVSFSKPPIIVGGIQGEQWSTSWEHMNFGNISKDSFFFKTTDYYSLFWLALGRK